MRSAVHLTFRSLISALISFPKLTPIILCYIYIYTMSSLIVIIVASLFLLVSPWYLIFMLYDYNVSLLTRMPHQYNKVTHCLLLYFLGLHLLLLTTLILTHSHLTKQLILVSPVADILQSIQQFCALLVHDCQFVNNVKFGDGEICSICQETFLPMQLQARTYFMHSP